MLGGVRCVGSEMCCMGGVRCVAWSEVCWEVV